MNKKGVLLVLTHCDMWNDWSLVNDYCLVFRGRYERGLSQGLQCSSERPPCKRQTIWTRGKEDLFLPRLWQLLFTLRSLANGFNAFYAWLCRSRDVEFLAEFERNSQTNCWMFDIEEPMVLHSSQRNMHRNATHTVKYANEKCGGIWSHQQLKEQNLPNYMLIFPPAAFIGVFPGMGSSLSTRNFACQSPVGYL